jgi:hypothetical protein
MCVFGKACSELVWGHICVRPIGYPFEYFQRHKDQSTVGKISLIWVVMPYRIVWTGGLTLLFPLYVQPGCSPSRHLRPRIPRLALPRSSFEARVRLLQLSSRGVSHAANARVYVAISRSKLVRCLSYISIKMVVCASSCPFVLLSSHP